MRQSRGQGCFSVLGKVSVCLTNVWGVQDGDGQQRKAGAREGQGLLPPPLLDGLSDELGLPDCQQAGVQLILSLVSGRRHPFKSEWEDKTEDRGLCRSLMFRGGLEQK